MRATGLAGLIAMFLATHSFGAVDCGVVSKSGGASGVDCAQRNRLFLDREGGY